MRLFLQVQIVSFVIGAIVQLYYLLCATHPRVEKTEKLSDFFRFIFQIAYLVWALYIWSHQ